ncbi:MAG: hypothetical protein M3R55_00920 [Acidobacteriota bacterium]|nr:hypothetical protein [Acidobacteriota bacterium]
MPRDTNEHGGPLGGQELPPEVQDRPEQNRGYDDAVAGKTGRAVETQPDTTSAAEHRRAAEKDTDRTER